MKRKKIIGENLITSLPYGFTFGVLDNFDSFTFGIYDNLEGKLRVGFVSNNIKELVIKVADEAIESSFANGGQTFATYKSKALSFKYALDIFEECGFTLAVIPDHIGFLLKERAKPIVDTSPGAFYDGSNEGVNLLNISYQDGVSVFMKYYSTTPPYEKYRPNSNPHFCLKGSFNMPSLSSEVTWGQAIETMKEVQKKHSIDLFAPGYFKSCSCCATPKSFPYEYFLNKEDTNSEKFIREDGSKIKSVILANAHNISGTPKFNSKKGYEVFGVLKNGLKSLHQYVYTSHLSTDKTKLILVDFVNGLNKLVGEETYYLELPEDEGYPFAICIKQ